MADDRFITLRLPGNLLAALRERARQEDRSVSQVIRVAARVYLSTPC